MDDSLVLTLDFGTQSVRAALVNKKGDFVAIVKKPYQPAYFSTQAGYAEQYADFYWDYATDCLKKITSENSDKLGRIIGATVTCFRDSSVQLDKDNKPLRPVILWLDQRMADAKEKLPLLDRIAFWLVGMKETVVLNRRRTIAHWLKENEPETWKNTVKYVNLSTYLVYKLTGKLVDSPACFTGHYPINFRKGKWYPDGAMKGIIFGIPKKMLCELVPQGGTLGTITDEVADSVGLPHGIKLISSGSDKACETIGLGTLSRDMAAVSYGTASTIEVSNQKYHEPEKFLPAYPAACPDWYNMEVQVYRGYWMLSWFTKEFATDKIDEAAIQNLAVEEVLNKKLNDIPPGSDGLVLQPYWGPGLKRPLSKGSIIGFSDVHTREHFYKAIIEGIAYALKEGLLSIEHSQKHKVSSVRISGGGSHSDAICQITADIFNLPVSRVQTFETTSLGAATATFTALGEFKDIEDGIAHMTHLTDTFYPIKNNVRDYEYLFKKVYLKMYPQMKSMYVDLKEYERKHRK